MWMHNVINTLNWVISRHAVQKVWTRYRSIDVS